MSLAVGQCYPSKELVAAAAVPNHQDHHSIVDAGVAHAAGDATIDVAVEPEVVVELAVLVAAVAKWHEFESFQSQSVEGRKKVMNPYRD